MYTSPPPEQIVTLIRDIYLVMNVGMIVSAFGNVVYPLLNKIRLRAGREPMSPDEFELFFHQLFRSVFDRIGLKVGALNLPERETEILIQIALGVVIVILAIAVEVILAPAVIGIALVTHRFTGMTFDPAATYQLLLALTVLFVFAFMNYGNQELRRNLSYR